MRTNLQLRCWNFVVEKLTTLNNKYSIGYLTEEQRLVRKNINGKFARHNLALDQNLVWLIQSGIDY